MMTSESNDWQPLILSSIAGASTCIGAAVVFCQPKDGTDRRIVSSGMMAFSLALAGSVMVRNDSSCRKQIMMSLRI